VRFEGVQIVHPGLPSKQVNRRKTVPPVSRSSPKADERDRRGYFLVIVPDGHWGQARKIVTREPSLAGLPRIKLPPEAPSRYRLRRNPVPGRVCTYEAVCLTLGLLEGPQVQEAMKLPSKRWSSGFCGGVGVLYMSEGFSSRLITHNNIIYEL
jgi:DTW domain-containing protein YfiP